MFYFKASLRIRFAKTWKASFSILGIMLGHVLADTWLRNCTNAATFLFQGVFLNYVNKAASKIAGGAFSTIQFIETHCISSSICNGFKRYKNIWHTSINSRLFPIAVGRYYISPNATNKQRSKNGFCSLLFAFSIFGGHKKSGQEIQLQIIIS